MVNAQDFRSLTDPELDQFLASVGERSFRSKQIFEWLWKKGCRSAGEMTSLPSSLRETISESFTFHVLQEETLQTSADGTLKTGFRTHDNLTIEGVLIPSEDRVTACISSQVGCALGCTFCATGRLGLHRNLTAAEIFDQVFLLDRQAQSRFGHPLSNIVMMGMGEPLANYPQVKHAVEILTLPAGFGLSPQRITISTVGIPKMIRRIAEDGLKTPLAISLHAASDGKRQEIIPFNQHHPLQELKEALIEYSLKTGKRFTIEYLLLKDFNDTVNDAAELAFFCKSFPVKINLIEYNPVPGMPYERSLIRQMIAFRDYLESKNMVVNVRRSRGRDISAACGQLAGNEMKT